MPTRRDLLRLPPVLALAGCATVTRGRPMADVLFTNGDIHTANAQSTRASALAVSANRIIAVGTTDTLKPLISSSTRVIDLAGRTVLPGINDSHLHLLMWALSRPPFALDLTHPNVKSIADCVALVRSRAQSRSAGEWIIGRGWDQAYLSEDRPPTAADLDAVAPNHPVVLTDFSGHAVWANSAALKISGIDANTVPPPGGVILKDEHGQPTGLLYEGAAWIVRRAVPEPTAAQHKDALRSAMQALLRRGITSCTVPGVSPEILQQMAELADEPFAAKLRVTALVRSPDAFDGLTEVLSSYNEVRRGNRLWFQTPGVKIMGDGIPTANKTAWLHDDYEGGGNGSLLIAGSSHQARVAEINRMIEHIHALGLQIGTHVTGDKSIDTVIDAYTRVQASKRFPDPRHYIIHGDLVSPETLSRMASAGIGANFNPEIKHLIADSQVAAIGAQRASYEWPYRTALDSGVIVASSSDAPVTEGNWLQGIATMISRKGKQTGKVSGPEQKIGLDEAIRTYTWAGAWQDRAEHYKGTLEAYKVADLCVLNRPIDSASPDELTGLNVSMTLVDGRVVHDELE